MAGSQVARFLARKHDLVIATTHPDTRPYAALTASFGRDSYFWVPTERGAARLRNLEEKPVRVPRDNRGRGRRAHCCAPEGPTRFVTPDGAEAATREWSEKFGGTPVGGDLDCGECAKGLLLRGFGRSRVTDRSKALKVSQVPRSNGKQVGR